MKVDEYVKACYVLLLQMKDLGELSHSLPDRGGLPSTKVNNNNVKDCESGKKQSKTLNWHLSFFLFSLI